MLGSLSIERWSMQTDSTPVCVSVRMGGVLGSSSGSRKELSFGYKVHSPLVALCGIVPTGDSQS